MIRRWYAAFVRTADEGDALVVVGSVLIVTGLVFVYWPLAVIAGGVFFLLAGFVRAFAKGSVNDSESSTG